MKTNQAVHDFFDLSKPLFSWSKEDAFCLSDAVTGVQSFGETGSGKSSGTARTMRRAHLAYGSGALGHTVKIDDRADWELDARVTGRADDLIIFSPESRLRFNFLQQELERTGRGAGITENLVHLFMNVLEIADRKSSHARTDAFWDNALKQLLRNAIELLVIAKNSLSVHDLYKIIRSAPQSLEETQSPEWRKSSFCFECLQEANAREKEPSQERDFEIAAEYWLSEFASLAEKTRSIIVASFTSMADCFLRGFLRELFTTDLTITPDETTRGKIVVLDFPLKEFGQMGLLAQTVFKLCWQSCMERRDISKNPRPVLWLVDESQLLLSSCDWEFQTTARSQRVCTVFLTQSISNYHAQFGAEGKARTDALLGNCTTKIFHANSDKATNEWACDLISKGWRTRTSSGHTSSGQNSSLSSNVSDSLEYEILPRDFSELKTGGRENNFEVEAIVFQSGKKAWNHNGKRYLKTIFRQEH